MKKVSEVNVNDDEFYKEIYYVIDKLSEKIGSTNIDCQKYCAVTMELARRIRPATKDSK